MKINSVYVRIVHVQTHKSYSYSLPLTHNYHLLACCVLDFCFEFISFILLSYLYSFSVYILVCLCFVQVVAIFRGVARDIPINVGTVHLYEDDVKGPVDCVSTYEYDMAIKDLMRIKTFTQRLKTVKN